MKKEELPQLTLSLFENAPGVELIDGDIAIFDNVKELPVFDRPVRVDAAVFAICLKGQIRVGLNLKEYTITQNQLVLSLPGQIVQDFENSEDLSGIFIIISKKFMEEAILHIQDIMPAFFYIKDHPVTELNAKELECIREYHAFLWDKVKAKDKPYRKEIALSLLLAMFHEICSMFKNHMITNVKRNRQEELFATFIQQLTLHFQKERSVKFYADKLYMTPKYLSLSVKKVSNYTAGEWIDQYVVLEAKALLSSSSFSIQEIADRLNFANQSFFGKYFKQHVGVSPSEYRKK